MSSSKTKRSIPEREVSNSSMPSKITAASRIIKSGPILTLQTEAEAKEHLYQLQQSGPEHQHGPFFL